MFNGFLFNSFIFLTVAFIAIISLGGLAFSFVTIFMFKKSTHRLLRIINYIFKAIFLLLLFCYSQIIINFSDMSVIDGMGYSLFVSIVPLILSLILFIKTKDYVYLVDFIAYTLMCPVFVFIHVNVYSVTLLVGLLLQLSRQCYVLVSRFLLSKYDHHYYLAKASLEFIDERLAIHGRGYNEFQNHAFRDLMEKLNINKYDNFPSLWKNILKHCQTPINDLTLESCFVSIGQSVYCFKKHEEKNFFEIIAYCVDEEISIQQMIKDNYLIEQKQKEELNQYLLNIKAIEKEILIRQIKSNYHNLLGQRASIIQFILNDYFQKDELDFTLLKDKLLGTFDEINRVSAVNFDDELDNLIHTFAIAGFDILIDSNVRNLSPLKNSYFVDIIRECATNSLRHARASKLCISLDKDIITIVDDQCIPMTNIQESTGIHSIKQNAKSLHAEVEISSFPGYCVKLLVKN